MAKFFRIILRLVGYGLLLALTIAVFFGVLYALHLDQIVRSRFDGKRWALPARVYARPLELYVGRTLTPDVLHAELNRLDYKETPQPKKDGSYTRVEERFLIRTRPFKFWDSAESARFLNVQFDPNGVSVLKDANTDQDLPLVRLDSMLIASIYPTDQEDRMVILRNQLPKLLVQTLLAVEDRQFYSHNGIDLTGIMRALWVNFWAGHLVQGGSTLTQQLAKNFYLTNERSFVRKINEIIMALALDRRYSKDSILETYANEIYLGQDGGRAIHGFGLASHFFFNKELGNIDLPRIALLVGIIKGPSYYDPRRHPERALERRNLVLDALVEQEIISAAKAAKAKASPLGITKSTDRPTSRYPAFIELVRNQLQRDYLEDDLQSEGLRIFTTLDPAIQASAEAGINKRLPLLELAESSEQLEAAAVVASSESGEILALVGGRRSEYAGFNRALNAVRSIGSLIKPIIYLEALSRKKYTLATTLQDTPVSIKGGIKGQFWRPKNYDHRVHGAVPLYLALAKSYNLATINLGLNLGLSSIVRRLRTFGITRPIPKVGPLLLGSFSLTPLEVTQIYQSIASGGFLIPLRSVLEVLDTSGKLLNHYPLEVKEIADPQAVWMLNWALNQVVENGTAHKLPDQLPPGLKVAGKTGTTDEYRDSWFAGFTGDKVAVVWVGRDDNLPAGLTGATGAMLVWGDIIGACDNRPWDAPTPSNIVLEWVNQAGRKVSANCANARQMPFRIGTIPISRGSCSGNGR